MKAPLVNNSHALYANLIIKPRNTSPPIMHQAVMKALDQSRSKLPRVVNVNKFRGFNNNVFNQNVFNNKEVLPQNEEDGVARKYSQIYEFPLPREYQEIQQKQLIECFRGFEMNATGGLGMRYTTRVTEMERRYLATPPLTDLDLCPEETMSKVYLLTNSNKGYRVGDPISLRVDLYDRRGTPRTKGGDDVRIVLNNSHRNFSVPVKVTDLRNGSYVGRAVLRWAGHTNVSALLTYSQEFLRLVVELRHSLLATRYIMAVYNESSGNVWETTPCLPSSPIPGYASTCNLTEANGAPFYCAEPVHPQLNCSSPFRHAILNYKNVSLLMLSQAYRDLNSLMNGKDNFRAIPNNIKIEVKEGVPPYSNRPPCWDAPKQYTWSKDWHQGWLSHHHWYPDRCSVPRAYSRELLVRCLRNVTVVLLGDSNARRWFTSLTETLGYPHLKKNCRTLKVKQMDWLNSSVLMLPHARPFSPGQKMVILDTLSAGQLFSVLPADRSYLIVLHYWMHLIFFPLDTIRERFRQAAKSIDKLLEKHPTAKVFLRGPHLYYDNKGHRAQRGDYVGPWVRRIAREEFHRLQDRVWFLDFWPLTLASRNLPYHPPEFITQQMIRLMLGYACHTDTELEAEI